uniref:Uncharacterized protein n=1 Tax=Magnetospirillum gryphiswaldense TaxID=55518 RepID=A4TYV2_9PROT|nr:hypothetical protein MGR_3373 [Magnetospirillum gryphiswaldense MSR-1]
MISLTVIIEGPRPATTVGRTRPPTPPTPASCRHGRGSLSSLRIQEAFRLPWSRPRWALFYRFLPAHDGGGGPFALVTLMDHNIMDLFDPSGFF